jgi:hypothetical protein
MKQSSSIMVQINCECHLDQIYCQKYVAKNPMLFQQSKTLYYYKDI